MLKIPQLDKPMKIKGKMYYTDEKHWPYGADKKEQKDYIDENIDKFLNNIETRDLDVMYIGHGNNSKAEGIYIFHPSPNLPEENTILVNKFNYIEKLNVYYFKYSYYPLPKLGQTPIQNHQHIYIRFFEHIGLLEVKESVQKVENNNFVEKSLTYEEIVIEI